MPVKAELIVQAQNSGIEPFTTLVSPVRRCISRETYAFRTVRQINSMQLGVLRPAQYRVVCDRTQQCVRLAKSDLTAAVRLARRLDDEGVEYEWLSVYIPVKLALKEEAAEIAEEILKAENLRNASKICLEIPSEALYEDIDKISLSLKNFKLLGLGTSLTAFGDEFCPANRLQGLPVDICMFDESVAKKMESSEGLRAASAMVAFVKSNGSDTIICTGHGKANPDIYSRAGFSGFTSSEYESGEKSWMSWEDYLKSQRQEGT